MKKATLFFCLILLLFSSACCKKNLQPDTIKQVEAMDDNVILANGDLQIKMGNQTTILEIDALPDSQIRQDERQRMILN